AFRSSIARPTDTSVYASSETSRSRLQDSRPGWSRCLLSCRALSSPTTCRFIPAHSGLPVTRSLPYCVYSGGAKRRCKVTTETISRQLRIQAQRQCNSLKAQRHLCNPSLTRRHETVTHENTDQRIAGSALLSSAGSDCIVGLPTFIASMNFSRV